jgi:dethiobiotin synthetase
MKPYFITATGTGIGKTLVTCALAWQLREQGKKVMALKPVISGFDRDNIEETDTGQLLQAQQLSPTKERMKAVSPWRFHAPLSPDMAAEEEQRTIRFDELTAFCKKPVAGGYLLIEGVGGVMTPLNEIHTVLDWMSALNYPVILVTGSYLGSLSHTLVSCHAILSRGLALHSVIVSETEHSTVPLARTVATLRRFLPDISMTAISRLDYLPCLWKYVPDLTPIVL